MATPGEMSRGGIVRSLGMVKNLPTNMGNKMRCGFNPWVGKIPWSRKWQPTPVLLLGEVHGQRRLVGYNQWGRRGRHC